MFTNKEEGDGGTTSQETETIIGPSVKVEGDFVGEGNVTVEGSVLGTLKTKQNLQVNETAKIKANVEAQNIVIAGEVKGNLKVTDKIELKSSAKVSGDITTKIISIESGAVFCGKCLSGDEAGQTKADSAKNSKSSKAPLL